MCTPCRPPRSYLSVFEDVNIIDTANHAIQFELTLEKYYAPTISTLDYKEQWKVLVSLKLGFFQDIMVFSSDTV